MNKRELIADAAGKAGCTQRDMEIALDALRTSAVGALRRGEEVRIPDFGSFKVKEVQGRIGKNPRTGETMKIAGHNAVKFSPAKYLKEVVQ